MNPSILATIGNKVLAIIEGWPQKQGFLKWYLNDNGTKVSGTVEPLVMATPELMCGHPLYNHPLDVSIPPIARRLPAGTAAAG